MLTLLKLSPKRRLRRNLLALRKAKKANSGLAEITSNRKGLLKVLKRMNPVLLETGP